MTKDGQDANEKDITDQYTGGEDITEDDLDYSEDEEGQDGKLDLTSIGFDSDRIGHLVAYGASYFICKPPEITVDGKTYNLRQRYMNSARAEFADLARNLGVEEALAEMELYNLTPGQLLGIFTAVVGLTAVRQRKEFQKEVKDLKNDIESNNNSNNEKEGD